MAVPVRLHITEADGNQRTVLATTLDANKLGAKLGGVCIPLTKGQVVTVQYQHRRCQFRIAWVGVRGTPTASQVGLECLDPGKNIWGVDLPDRVADIGVGRKGLVFASAGD